MPAITRVERRSSSRRTRDLVDSLVSPDMPSPAVSAPNRSIPSSPSGPRYTSILESNTAPHGSVNVTSDPPRTDSLSTKAFEDDLVSYRSATSSPPRFLRPCGTTNRRRSPVCAMDLGMPDRAYQICPDPHCDCERSPKGSYVNPLYKRRRLTAVVGEPFQERMREDQLKYFLLVSAVNSFTQLVYTQLKDRAGPKAVVVIHIFAPGGKCTNGQNDEKVLMEALSKVKPHMVICPFLTTKVPSVVFNSYLTLVVHPGPPGDVGPSSLDWTLLGDMGDEEDATLAMQYIREGPKQRRSHWGCVVFQANDDMDKGPVWAWDEYLMPTGRISKGQLYQNYHSPAAWRCIDTAIDEVIWACNAKEKQWSAEVNGAEVTLPPSQWASQLSPSPHCATHPVTPRSDPAGGFRGGPLRHRPVIAVKDRKLDMLSWSANRVQLFISAFDSQPGAQFPAPTKDSKTNLFVYGAHVHKAPVPPSIYREQGYATYDEVPDGTALATRRGAVFYKTKQDFVEGDPIGVWITHGRAIRPLGQPLEAKVPLKTALIRSGHGKHLADAVEWPLDFTQHHEGTWQEVYVHCPRVDQHGGLFTFVYWDFYNGAFSTEACRLLLKALQWATSPERRVAALILMGGQYFSNGIALNTIEDRSSEEAEQGIPEEQRSGAAEETWDNINAIDDIVEFLAGDSHDERSDFLKDTISLTQRGIVTVAAMRGNAAAGGVALAAACDVVMVTDNVILNPAYRAMGLHGSELHSWSYTERCGQDGAAHLLTQMLPMSPQAAYKMGLVDAIMTREDASFKYTRPDKEIQLGIMFRLMGWTLCRAAPWAHFVGVTGLGVRRHAPIELRMDDMITRKLLYFAWMRGRFWLPPLVHYRNEELTQMLLDCFHPTRSLRYHTRRRAFIRKIKCGITPTRYQRRVAGAFVDEEETPDFDDAPAAPGHERGDEWHWVREPIPKSLEWSAWTKVDLFDTEPIDSHVDEVYGPDGPYRLIRTRILRTYAPNLWSIPVREDLRGWLIHCPLPWQDDYHRLHKTGELNYEDFEDPEFDPELDPEYIYYKERQEEEQREMELIAEREEACRAAMEVDTPVCPNGPPESALEREQQHIQATPRVPGRSVADSAILPFSRSASPEPSMEAMGEWTTAWISGGPASRLSPDESPVLYVGPSQPATIPRQSRRLSQLTSSPAFANWT